MAIAITQESPELARLRAFEAYHAIMTLDLTEIEVAVRQETGWDEQSSSAACGEYRRLLLLRLAGYVKLAVPVGIGRIWHGHILKTEDYIPFCDRWFGSYFPHRHGDWWELHGSREGMTMVYTDFFGCAPPEEVWSGSFCCLAYSGPFCINTTGGSHPPAKPTEPSGR